MFKVTIAQKDPNYQYSQDKLVADFDKLTEAWSFVSIAFKHCEDITVVVEKVEPEIATLTDMECNVRAEKEV